jgi:hypothetical protein
MLAVHSVETDENHEKCINLKWSCTELKLKLLFLTSQHMHVLHHVTCLSVDLR